METWEHLTLEQKKQVREVNQQIRELPPPRRKMVHNAIRDMRGLTPEEREQRINSDSFKSTFSEHERELLSGASRLPLAPVDNTPNATPNE